MFPLAERPPATMSEEKLLPSQASVSDFGTLFSPPLFHAPNKMVRVIKGKLYRNDLKRNKNYFELKGGSNYRGFESPRVKLK